MEHATNSSCFCLKQLNHLSITYKSFTNCHDRWYLARVQPLIPRIAHVGWNYRTTEMLIDESKMAVDSSFSFLNLRKQDTILN